MTLSRIRQEDEKLRDSLPHHWLKGLAQNEEEEARRRRHMAPPAPPPPEALAIIVPARREGGRRSFFTCRCLDGSLIELEEGEKCPPGCYPITQGEAVPVAPLLVTFGLIGFLAYAIVKRPFG